MEKKRGRRTIVVAAVAVCLSVAVSAGCVTSSKTASNSKGATAASGSTSMIEWGASHPLEYQSFYSDYRFVKLDGRLHGHSNLFNKLNTWPPGTSRPAALSCMACKSADMNKLYEKYGDAVLSTPLPSDPNYSGKKTSQVPAKPPPVTNPSLSGIARPAIPTSATPRDRSVPTSYSGTLSPAT